jgi:uncharacterized protein YbjT (DUF2867 family)
MRILVIGGTGKVGSALAGALAEKGLDVRVMTRTPGATTSPSGVETAAGDMTRPDTLPAAFEGVDRCYLLTPLAQDEVEQGLNAVEAARRAGIERLVFQSIFRAVEAPAIPHFASKVRILDRIRESGLPWAVVSPSSFYQNDVAMRDLILGPGIYPNPLGSVGVNRVDVRDIAGVAAAALLEPGYESREIVAVGPDNWTGQSIADVYSGILGREIRYSGDDLEAWSAGARNFLPEWLVHDLGVMLAHFQEKGLVASHADLAQTQAALGREPRPFFDFAQELVAGA